MSDERRLDAPEEPRPRPDDRKREDDWDLFAGASQR